jgi:hypothetical protein
MFLASLYLSQNYSPKKWKPGWGCIELLFQEKRPSTAFQPDSRVILKKGSSAFLFLKSFFGISYRQCVKHNETIYCQGKKEKM